MSDRLLIPIVFLLLAGCAEAPGDLPVQRTEVGFEKEGELTFLHPDGTPIRTIDIEITDSRQEMAQGLMARRQMGYDRGMLFPYAAPDTLGFWMRNTYLSLDIVFVGADSQVVNIVRGTTPLSEEEIFSEGPAQFVVEVRRGFADRFGLTDSTRITWTRTPTD